MVSRILKGNKKSEKVEKKKGGGRKKGENLRPIKFHTGEAKYHNLVLVLILFCYSCSQHKPQALVSPTLCSSQNITVED